MEVVTWVVRIIHWLIVVKAIVRITIAYRRHIVIWVMEVSIHWLKKENKKNLLSLRDFLSIHWTRTIFKKGVHDCALRKIAL